MAFNEITRNQDSKSNLTAVIERLIILVHEDLNALNELLEKTDPFSLHHNLTHIETKRERCLKLLKVLQSALLSENQWGKENNISSIGIIDNDNEKSKTADEIMFLLRKNQFIKSSELAEYLQTTLLGDGFECSSTIDYDNTQKKELKSIRKLSKIYNTPQKKK